jgi:ParB-like chromosome segregation protein Spo0J
MSRFTPTTKELLISALLPPTHGRPFDMADAEDQRLKVSIQKDGVLAPLVVFRRGGNRYEIVDGGRRLAAAKAVGKSSVPCMVLGRLQSGDCANVRYALNHSHRALSHSERIAWWKKLKAMTPDELRQVV